jgi:hypothetical protein
MFPSPEQEENGNERTAGFSFPAPKGGENKKQSLFLLPHRRDEEKMSTPDVLDDVATAGFVYGWFMALFVVGCVALMFAGPMSSYRNSFSTPVPGNGANGTAVPGERVTTWWSVDFWITSTLAWFWFVPLTAFFVLAKPHAAWRFHVRWVVLLVLLVYFLGCWLWWAIVCFPNANAGTAGNWMNPANDARWCCVYYNIPGTLCDNVDAGACQPGVGASMLIVNGVFLYKFGTTAVLWILMVVDLCLFFFYWGPAVRELRRYLDQRDVEMQRPPPSSSSSGPRAGGGGGGGGYGIFQAPQATASPISYSPPGASTRRYALPALGVVQALQPVAPPPTPEPNRFAKARREDYWTQLQHQQRQQRQQQQQQLQPAGMIHYQHKKSAATHRRFP